MNVRWIQGLIAIILAISLAGCASYHQPRYGHDGVYYDPPVVQHRVVYADPLLYPYWSLDYFYFSRHYHPYSIYVDSFDPWYYPYPGWYYGYRPGIRTRISIGYSSHWYPWYGFGVHYHHHQPWGPRYIHYPRHRTQGWVHEPRVRQIDHRLREMERRQTAAAATTRDPGNRAIHAEQISTRRSATGQSSRQAQRQSSPATIPRQQGSPRRAGFPALRGQTDAPVVRDRATGRERAPIERQSAPQRQREPVQGRSPRQQQAPRQQPPAQRPQQRSTPTAPPRSQPTAPPQRQSAPPRQRSEQRPPRTPRRERREEP